VKQRYVFTLVAGALAVLAVALPGVPRAFAQHDAGVAPASAHGGASPALPAAAPAGTRGVVVETMDAAGYTYVQVDDGSKKTWAAAPRFDVSVGDKVVVPPGSAMPNFESKSLGRKFDMIYFVAGVQVEGRATKKEQLNAAHGGAPAKAPAVKLDFSDVEKADGGYTVAELFEQKDSLAGKEVAVRGKVAKFTANVMKKNWVHLRDGSGTDGTNDLTVTTTDTATVGDLVLMRGTLGVEKDFGFGYKYGVIVEDASLSTK